MNHVPPTSEVFGTLLGNVLRCGRSVIAFAASVPASALHCMLPAPPSVSAVRPSSMSSIIHLTVVHAIALTSLGRPLLRCKCRPGQEREHQCHHYS
jgi:hypothetical protein